jgi:hypothetical protein
MAWICEIVVSGGTDAPGGFRKWISESVVGRLPDTDGLRSADLYEPADERGRDPFNHDTDAPLLIAILDLESEDALRRAMSSAPLADVVESVPHGLTVTVTALERASYAVDDDPGGSDRDAPISYVVRYHRPAEDEDLFRRNYVASHPPTQAKLPGIRSVMCYFPRPDLNPSQWPSLDYLIGNEVAFDTVADFNVAMESPVRQELRAHYRDFPSFSGANTHFLMRRTRIARRSASVWDRDRSAPREL